MPPDSSQMPSDATEQMSSVATEEMSSVATEEMSSVATEDISSVVTKTTLLKASESYRNQSQVRDRPPIPPSL